MAGSFAVAQPAAAADTLAGAAELQAVRPQVAIVKSLAELTRAETDATRAAARA